MDFTEWNHNKFTASADFLKRGERFHYGSDTQLHVPPVPEPDGLCLLLVATMIGLTRSRRCPTPVTDKLTNA